MNPSNITGDKLAWKLLAKCNPTDVCQRSKAHYDVALEQYHCICFGQEIIIDLHEKKIGSTSSIGKRLADGLDYYFNLAILWYLINAKELDPSDRLVNPISLKGGDIFRKGTHVLPLDRLAARYGQNPENFFASGRDLGGKSLEYGDASLLLLPFPRIPFTLILWAAEEEFPARTDLLVDSTCELHLPTDVIWSTAMATVLAML